MVVVLSWLMNISILSWLSIIFQRAQLIQYTLTNFSTGSA